MSFLVATMKKLKASDLGGIQKEMDRQYSDNSAYKNDVDSSRSGDNVELVSEHKKSSGALRQETMNYINQHKVSSRKVRKDAVVLNSWIISSDHSFFDKLSREQAIQFFSDAKDFYADRYGAENIRNATIHLDETTPHMHMGVVPLRNGRLTSKTIITPVELQKLQKEFPAYMQSKGWDIERGIEGHNRKHLDAPEYREATEAAKKLDQQNIALEAQNEQLEIINTQTKVASEQLSIGINALNTLTSPNPGPQHTYVDNELEKDFAHEELRESISKLPQDLSKLLKRLWEMFQRVIRRENVIEQRKKDLVKRELEIQKHERELVKQELNLQKREQTVDKGLAEVDTFRSNLADTADALKIPELGSMLRDNTYQEHAFGAATDVSLSGIATMLVKRSLALDKRYSNTAMQDTLKQTLSKQQKQNSQRTREYYQQRQMNRGRKSNPRER